MVALAFAAVQKAKVYVFAAHPDPSVDDPTAFDCSGLVGWVCGRLHTSPALGWWPPNSVSQWMACQQAGTVISIAEAIATPGALLFNHRDDNRNPVDPQGWMPPHAHVAFSRGDGTTVEALGTAWGCGVFHANPAADRWTAGALIPGVVYSGAVSPTAMPTTTTTTTTTTRPSSGSPIPPFPGEASLGVAATIALAWQKAMIACEAVANTQANQDGVFGPGMVAAIDRLQTSFGWTPDHKGGAHTWTHMWSRQAPPCPRCGT